MVRIVHHPLHSVECGPSEVRGCRASGARIRNRVAVGFWSDAYPASRILRPCSILEALRQVRRFACYKDVETVSSAVCLPRLGASEPV